MKKLIFLLFVLPVFIFSSCRYIGGKRVSGSGHVISQTRSAGQFNSIHVSGAIQVYVKQDSASSIKVEGDDNLLEYVEVIDEGDELQIKTRDGYNLSPSKDIRVYVSSPVFKNFDASGACKIISENQVTSSERIDIDLSGASDVKMDVNAPKITAGSSGAGTIELKGQTKDFEVEGSGATNIKCVDLMAENVSVHMSGAGDAQVYASSKLDVHVSGAGSVKYKGNASVSQNVSGAGSVSKMD